MWMASAPSAMKHLRAQQVRQLAQTAGPPAAGERPSTLIGIDLGKHVFHLHAQDGRGREVFRKKLSRAQLLPFFSNLQAVTVVMEACAGSHWLARKLNAMGHRAKLISAQYVRPFVKSNKNLWSSPFLQH
jgi:hypothetical protein